ncbi:selenium cofactor biosynthesis protein YqeC [Desulfuromonas sp. TF]|uniref:selenium cofactor biosynthesis protein YqeC n=1 Tax=Desulfuromonas sp. TF TaxID=1232410 RepID=UPI0003F57FA9|nr:selenium cofactor biosynthesis protein YqeC [Desulfuromonas sp. TF]
MILFEEILDLRARGVVSFVGGGGKTSLMFHLARQLARSGRRVLTTTTTKIFVPTPDQSPTVLVSAEPREVLRQLELCDSAVRHVTAAAALLSDGGKLKGFDPEAISRFEESDLFDWILVEADGSARRPLKAPAEHEPVIPACTTVLVAVAGLEVLGSPLNEDLVFRSALAAELMELAEGETVTAAALAALFAHSRGAFKGSPSRARRFIFLNKADTPGRIEGGARIAELLRRSPSPIAEALIVGQALGGIRVHAVHPLAVGS